MREVIEDDPRSGHDDVGIGPRNVGRRLRTDAFQRSSRVIRERADRAARKRQATALDRIPREKRANPGEELRIVVVDRRLEIVEPDERVARDAVGSFDRLQQTRTPRLSQGEEGADRRDRIRDERTHRGLQREGVFRNDRRRHTAVVWLGRGAPERHDFGGKPPKSATSPAPRTRARPHRPDGCGTS